MTQSFAPLHLTSICVAALGALTLPCCSMGESATADDQEIPDGLTVADDETTSTSTGDVPDDGVETSGVPAEDEGLLAREVQTLFEAECAQCHGEGGPKLGGIDYITDLAALVANGKVARYDLDASRVYARVTSADAPMPPLSEKGPLADEDIDLIRRWILAGAPAASVPADCQDNPFISLDEMIISMNADIAATPIEDRRFVRYLTLTHLYNSGLCSSALDTYRAAISKLINSLSREPLIVQPDVLGADGTILRIDLRDYGWDDNPIVLAQGISDAWEASVLNNPYAIEYDGDFAIELKADTKTVVPFQPADGFLQIVSRGQLYYDLLELPETVEDLEGELGVANPEASFDVGEIVRAAFDQSGVSIWNRIIERRRIAFAGSRAYWRSYDFGDESGFSNVFAHPLDFQEGGGEIIFTLENGTQAYMLIDSDGTRLFDAPISIVRDPKQRDFVVKNGISCMSCHEAGIIPKQDEVLPFFKANKSLFPVDDRPLIEDLYRPHEEMDPLQAQDAKNFQSAMDLAGVDLSSGEPVVAASLAFEANLDLRRAAAEFGVTPLRLEQSLSLLDPSLQVLRFGTVSREAFTAQYQEAICALLPGDDVFPACPKTQ